MKAPWGGAPPPLVLFMGVLQQAFIDGLVFGVPDDSGACFWSSGAHLFPNLRCPGAQNGPRWNFVRNRGQAPLKFFTALATFRIFGDLAGRPNSTKNQSLAPNGVPGSDVLSIFVTESVFLTFGLGFSSIFHGKNDLKNNAFFQRCAHSFQPGEALKPCTGAVF